MANPTYASPSPSGTLADDGLDYRPSYLAASIVGIAIFLLYLITLAPTTAMWDTSEYITAAYTLGLPHPPGNPFFVLIGRVFAVLPIGPTVAYRINILAAVCSAASAAMWFLITERVLVNWLPVRWQRIVGAAAGTLIGATAFTVWNQSVVNEKVYTVSLLGIAVISWLMIRWSDEPDGRKADRILVVVAYLLALGYTNHMAGALPGLAAGVAVLVRRPKTIFRWRLILAAAAVGIIGMTPFATQPIRAAHMPELNEGEPTACQDGLKFDCTFSKLTYERFMYNFNRGQYGKPELTQRQAPLTGQIGMWWYYFKWQWLRDAHAERPGTQALLAAVFLVLGLFGGWVHYKRDRRSFWYFGTLMFSMTLLLIYYLNFKYGATQAPELQGVDREVRDRDYFYLWSFSAWGVWAGLGIVYLWESIASLFGTERVRLGKELVEEPTRRSWLKGSPILAMALIPLFTNWSTAPRWGQTDTADFARDLLNSVEPYGVLVVVGDNDTFPLWYAQEVEGVRKDVVIANTSLLNTDWYTRQLIRRPVHEYDAAKGPAIYRDKQWTKPNGPPLKLTLMEADSVPPYMVLNKPTALKLGAIDVTIDPNRLQNDGRGNGYLQRADMFVLRMIADSQEQGRPVYFSRTSGGYARELGLGNNVLTQGLAAKVFIPPAKASRDTTFQASDGWMDVARTKELWDTVFEAPKSLIKRGDWIDQPSAGIPLLYIYAGVELAEALRERDPAAASRILEQSKGVAKTLNMDAAVQSIDQMMPSALPPQGDTASTKTLPILPPAPAAAPSNAPPTKAKGKSP